MTHDWQPVVAPNGDRGWQCQRCKLTAITLKDWLMTDPCPHVPEIPFAMPLSEKPADD